MWFIVFIVLVAIVYLFLIFPSPRKHPDRLLCNKLYIAHRGLHSLKDGIPENSIVAFENAILHGFAIEIDIHLTADGKVVIFHDDTLKRVCNIDQEIEKMTYSELSKLRLFDTNYKIPLLKDMLRTVDGKVPILIEFKCMPENYQKLCVATNKILKDYKGKYFIQSFNPLVLYWYRKNCPSIYRGQLAEDFSKEPKKDFVRILVGYLLLNFLARPDFVAYNIDHTNSVSRCLCIFLGAVSAGWTFRSRKDLDKYKKNYDIYIFEDFIPKK